MHNPPHPGEVLREYLVSFAIADVAAHIGMSDMALQRVIDGAENISVDMAYRLGDALNTSPEFWAGMQLDYDIYQASLVPRPKIECLSPAFTAAYD
jgi:addiction module HigA family antidote